MHSSILLTLGMVFATTFAAPLAKEPSDAEIKAAIDLFKHDKRQFGEIATGLGVLGGALKATSTIEGAVNTPRAAKRQVGEVAAGLGVLSGVLGVTSGTEALANSTPRSISDMERRQFGEVAAAVGAGLGIVSGTEGVINNSEALSTPRAVPPQKRQVGEVAAGLGVLSGVLGVTAGTEGVINNSTPRALSDAQKRSLMARKYPQTTSHSLGQMDDAELTEGLRQIGAAAIQVSKQKGQSS